MMHVHFLAAVPVCLYDRRLVTFPAIADGRLVRCSIDSATLARLWGRPVETEDAQAEAFAVCRAEVEALVCRLLGEGRGAGGGLCITPGDLPAAAAHSGVCPAGAPGGQ